MSGVGNCCGEMVLIKIDGSELVWECLNYPFPQYRQERMRCPHHGQVIKEDGASG